MEQKRTRCRFTKDGLESMGEKQMLGYAIGEVNNNQRAYVRVLWDGKKSVRSYHKDFIDTDPLVALLTDEEQAEIRKESEIQVTPIMVDSIEKNLAYIKETGLSDRAIVTLLREYIGASRINKKQIEAVIDALPRIKEIFLK